MILLHRLIMSPNIEITNSGLKYDGSWENICDFARNLEGVIKKCVSNEDSIEQYHEWRPRKNEKYKDMTEKTAKEAALKTKDVEKKFNGTKQELKDVEMDLKKSVVDVKNGKSPSKDIKDASKHIERLVEAESVLSLRKMEMIIYEKLMLKFNPDYFDTEDFSVNLEKNHKNYVLRINITDEDRRNTIMNTIMKEEEFIC